MRRTEAVEAFKNGKGIYAFFTPDVEFTLWISGVSTQFFGNPRHSRNLRLADVTPRRISGAQFSECTEQPQGFGCIATSHPWGVWTYFPEVDAPGWSLWIPFKGSDSGAHGKSLRYLF